MAINPNIDLKLLNEAETIIATLPGLPDMQNHYYDYIQPKLNSVRFARRFNKKELKKNVK
jgi:hypothetical protein